MLALLFLLLLGTHCIVCTASSSICTALSLSPGARCGDPAPKTWWSDETGSLYPQPNTPAVYIVAASVQDVQAVLRYAIARNVTIKVRAEAHSPFSTTDSGILLSLSGMNNGTFKLMPGNVAAVCGSLTWQQMYKQANELNLEANGGDCSSVAVFGYIMGGGVGGLSRRVGMGVDSVLSLDIVLANGTLVTASNASHPNLFWAVRGGGAFGSFGIIVGGRFQLYPIVEETSEAITCWTVEAAASVLNAYIPWVTKQTDNYYDTGSLAHRPLPALCVLSTFTGPKENASRVLMELAQLGDPFGHRPYVHIMMRRGQNVWTTVLSEEMWIALEHRTVQMKSFFVNDWAPAMTSVLIDYVAQNKRNQFVWHILGGAMARISSGSSPYPHRNATWLLATMPFGFSSSESAQIGQMASNCVANLTKLGAYGAYPNYADPHLGEDFMQAYYGSANSERLISLKRAYDPTCFFKGPQNIPCA